MESKHPSALVAKIGELLKDKPHALSFILAYGEYVEIADDLVDEPFSIDRLQRLTALACQMYSSDYYMRNREKLYMVEMLNNLTFFDTVKWENSNEEWKIRDARCLNHCAYNMLFAVLILECGFDATKGISLEFRESAHKNQLADIKLPTTNTTANAKLPE